MPKWKKDETEFPVSVTKHETRGFQSYLPKPIMEFLGNPDFIKFVIKGKKVHVEPHKD
jgi:hypothetical protein